MTEYKLDNRLPVEIERYVHGTVKVEIGRKKDRRLKVRIYKER